MTVTIQYASEHLEELLDASHRIAENGRSRL
jgi:hypothetical protein